jgi:hypothetical protein
MRFPDFRVRTLLAACLVCASIAACGGGGADVKSVVYTTTTGQQLIDLQKAFEAGAITKDQYDQQKARILKGQ